MLSDVSVLTCGFNSFLVPAIHSCTKNDVSKTIFKSFQVGNRDWLKMSQVPRAHTSTNEWRGSSCYTQHSSALRQWRCIISAASSERRIRRLCSCLIFGVIIARPAELYELPRAHTSENESYGSSQTRIAHRESPMSFFHKMLVLHYLPT